MVSSLQGPSSLLSANMTEQMLQQALTAMTKENEQLRQSLSQLQAKLQEKFANSPSGSGLHLPAWAVRHDNHTPTLAGLLYLRVAFRNPYGGGGSDPLFSGRNDTLFSLGPVDIVQVCHSKDPEDQDAVALFIQHNARPMILYDDPRLYPSDALLTKLAMLCEAKGVAK